MNPLNTFTVILAASTVLASFVIVVATSLPDQAPPPAAPPQIPNPPPDQAPAPPSQASPLGEIKPVGKPPQPPPPPEITAEDALREVNHAYNDLREIRRIMKIAEEKGLSVERASDVISLATDLYNKALKYYNSGDYLMTMIYSHLSCETSHGAHEILARVFAENSVTPPPPYP